jgi:hypothetical protein
MESTVAEIVAKYGTRDPREIAERAGVLVIFERWHPITLGEFERKTDTIRINVNAEGIDTDTIIAHELGHFFAAGLNLNREEDEKFAREFAEVLTN